MMVGGRNENCPSHTYSFNDIVIVWTVSSRRHNPEVCDIFPRNSCNFNQADVEAVRIGFLTSTFPFVNLKSPVSARAKDLLISSVMSLTGPVLSGPAKRL